MTLQECLKRVESFQKASHQLVNEKPTNISVVEAEFRDTLIREEVMELHKATIDGDLTGALDGLADIAYVLFGTVNALGMQHVFTEAFKRVCESNDTKLTGGRLIKDKVTGKVLKPDTFVPVKLEDLVK